MQETGTTKTQVITTYILVILKLLELVDERMMIMMIMLSGLDYTTDYSLLQIKST